MVDIHTHILPGLDDGAMDICEAIEMIRMAAECGTDMIVATPHCNYPGMYDNYFGKEYIETYERTVKAVEEEGINIKLCPGMEAFATYELPDLIVDGKIMPLNQSRYILVEFSREEEPDFADNVLGRMKNVGAKPVIAHAERYRFVQDNPQKVYEWREKGYVIQNNKASFQGKFGKKAQKAAYYMLERHLTSVVASDAHGIKCRTTNMEEVHRMLEEKISKKYLNVLFEENPRRICENLPIISFKVISIEDMGI